MNCYVCAMKEVVTAAVATCPACGVGLCLEHRRAQVRGPGGTAIECPHTDDLDPRAPALAHKTSS